MANHTTILINDTVTQGQTLLMESPRPQLLQTRYFPTDNVTDVFDSKKVMLDFDNGDLQSGAFFQKGYGDGSKTTFYSEVCEPPRIAESDIIDAGDRDRVLFEQLCRAQGNAMPSHADALNDLLRIKAGRCADRVQRGIERLCSMLLQKNALALQYKSSPTASTNDVTVDVQYFNDETTGAAADSGKNPQVYESKAWGGADATPYDDVCAMCRKLVQNGGNAVDLLMSPQMWGHLIADITKKMGNGMPQINYTIINSGDKGGLYDADILDAQHVGSANFGGYVLNLIVYSGAYTTIETNKEVFKPYLPENFVCVLAPNVGHTLCGAVNKASVGAFVNGGDAALVRHTGKFIVTKYFDFANEQVSVRCESLPLPAPYRRWGWITKTDSAGA